jgi:hypothetical protein
MAKRVRGSSSRPGQRRRLQRSSTPRARVETPPSSAPSTSLTAAEEARAAELEAQIVAAEKEAEAAATRSRERGRRAPESETRVRTGSIAMRASEEYAYVARDVRRLIIIGGSLIASLIVLWVVTQASGVGPF